jgi:hypothetical protein
MSCRRSLLALTLLVIAQATTEEFKGEAKLPPVPPPPAPRDGFWAPPPGESGASRHAPRPGPGDAPPAQADGDEVEPIELPKGSGANP